MKTRVCICFMGLDGSGKTSHVINLSKNLSKAGIKPLYIRPEYLLEKYLPQSLLHWISQHVLARSKVKTGESRKFIGHNEFKHIGYNIIKFFLNVGFLIYVWLMHTLIINLRSKRYVLIYDRYFYDWIYYLNGVHATVLTQLIPKPDLIFLLDLGVSDAFSRMHSEEDKLFSTNYYSSLRNWYLTLAKKYGFIIVDSAQGFSVVERLISGHVISFLRRRGLSV